MKDTTSKKAERWRKKILSSGVDLDMNPMVDMAFLLLTFFMLTTTLTRPYAMELIMPADDHDNISERPSVKASRVLVLIPFKTDTVLYYQGLPDKPFSTLILSDQRKTDEFFRSINSAIHDPVILVKPSEDCPFETVVRIIDLLNNHGLNRYALDDLNVDELKYIYR